MTKFNELILDILRKQVLLKNIITPDDWNGIKEVLFLDYLKDSYYVETKNAELRKQRSGELNELEKYIGKYYSHYWIRSQVLGMTEGEMREMDKQMTEERNKGMYPSTGSPI
jgi:protoheme ferro-lyase